MIETWESKQPWCNQLDFAHHTGFSGLVLGFQLVLTPIGPMSMVTSGKTQMNHQMNQITCQCQTCRVCMHIYIYVCVCVSLFKCTLQVLNTQKKQVRLIWHSMSQHHHFINGRSSKESSFTRNESQWYALINQMDQEGFWISEYKKHVQLPRGPMLIHNDYGVMGSTNSLAWPTEKRGSWLRSCK